MLYDRTMRRALWPCQSGRWHDQAVTTSDLRFHMRLAAFVVTAVLPLLGWSGGGRPVDPGVVVNGGVRGSDPTRVPQASVPPPVVLTPPAKTPTTPVIPTSDISMAAKSWIIGPIIDGQNYSHNMPLLPAQDGAGWSFDFPAMDGVDYVATPYGGGAAAVVFPAVRRQLANRNLSLVVE